MKAARKNTDPIFKDPRLYVAVGLLLLTGACFYYQDVNSIIRQGMVFWDALFSGKLFSFYSMCREASKAGLCGHECTYGIVQAFFMAIWQLPLFLIEKIAGGNILRFFIARLYGKLYTIAIAILTGREIAAVAAKLGMKEEKRRDLFLAFLASGSLIVSACVVGQIDILGTLFLIKTVKAVIDKDDRKFLLWFFLAVSCKIFALFFIIPVLLLTEKKIVPLLLKLGLPIGLYLLSDLPFSLLDAAGTAAKKGRLDGMVACMLGVRIKLFAVNIPVFFLLFAFICIIAWLRNDNENRTAKILWTALCGGTSLLASMDISVYDYWYIYLTPFILLLIYRDGAGFKELLVMTVSGFAWIAGNIFALSWTFDATDNMLAAFIFGKGGITVKDIYLKFGHESYHGAWAASWAVYAVALFILIWFSYPWKKQLQNEAAADDARACRILMIFRTAGNFLLCNIAALLLLTRFFK
ncbi:MAG: hypothetical protein K5686_06445 [Lachnospiraceae bacterium]|nr:hypothetical protein [Lachnospiraceae bacterium]